MVTQSSYASLDIPQPMQSHLVEGAMMQSYLVEGAMMLGACSEYLEAAPELACTEFGNIRQASILVDTTSR